MSWFNKLKSGLTSSSTKIGGGISDIFTKRKLDDETVAKLEELLISADLGVETAVEISEKLSAERFGRETSGSDVKQFVALEITKILKPATGELKITSKPFIVLVVGVNGNGKTTSIGKLANYYKSTGLKPAIAAADTFRAAAVEQLKIWGERAGVAVYQGIDKQDPASVVYQAIEKAKADGVDILFIDTAGRLQNKSNLMLELTKIKNVCNKLIPDSPHEVILVLDATTGQNAISQVTEFKDKAGLTGLIITKLDGTAKGGVVVSLAKKFALKIYAIGVGEGIDDLKPFDADEFAKSLIGL